MFLARLLPDTGVYCIAVLLPSGKFRHIFADSIEAVSNHVDTLNSAGKTVYVAQASFNKQAIDEALAANSVAKTKEERKKLRSQDNAAYLKNFFLDIDCGEKWPLKNQMEGAQELRKFIIETGLPMPTVVNSGNGLYAHWILSKAIPARQWRTVAKVLKQVVAAYSPAIGGDSSRTSDSASVLRPPGTTNRKPGRPEKPVRIVTERDDVDFLRFARALGAAAKKKKINRDTLLPPVASSVEDYNADLMVYQDSPPSDPNIVADSCAQLATMRETRGNVTEPLWYACLGLLAFCEGGAAAAQDWSSGHPSYSFGQTEAKMQQWLDTGMGPATCAKFGEVNPKGCIGCASIGLIKSPIVLGRPAPEQLALPEEQCPPPPGFRRSAEGLFMEHDGRWLKFYDMDLYIDRLAYDESLGYEVMVIRHKLPFDGDMECVVRSSLVNDPKQLMTTLADAHIKVVGSLNKKNMVSYMEGYQHTLQRNRRMTMLLCSMGWKDIQGNGKPMFVLGKKIFHNDGTTEDASFARNVPQAAMGFRSAGDLNAWVEATKILGTPGMEPLAFSFLAGWAGAPLMKYTGFAGALVSMYGKSGSGKTLLLRMIHSAWGYHDDLIMLRNDTRNATISRLGVYNNLPLCVDEITNIGVEEASELAYQITQGKEKARLTAKSEEKKNQGRWNTIAVTSSNSSLIDLLSTGKVNPDGEVNRIFEFEVFPHPLFANKATTDVYWTIDSNYGLAGEVYAKWMVQNPEAIRRALEKIGAEVAKEADLKADERYWGAAVTAAIVGGLIAKKLGLVKFDIAPIHKWAIAHIKTMRKAKYDMSGSAVDTLSKFVADNVSNRLIVVHRNNSWIIMEHPKNALTMRLEVDKNMLYVSRASIQHAISKSYGSYSKVRSELLEKGVLLNANIKKVLGLGTMYAAGPQACWQIDLGAKELQESGMASMVALSDKTYEVNMEALLL